MTTPANKLFEDCLKKLRTARVTKGYCTAQDMTMVTSLNDQFSGDDPFGPCNDSLRYERDELLALGAEHDDLKRRLLRAHWIRQRSPWKAGGTS